MPKKIGIDEVEYAEEVKRMIQYMCNTPGCTAGTNGLFNFELRGVKWNCQITITSDEEDFVGRDLPQVVLKP